MESIFNYDFMMNAIYASILASIVCGIVGTYVVVKRIVFISGGISHTAYGGIGLGYFLGFNPLYGAIGFSLLTAGFLSVMRKKKSQHEDTIIGIMWALGMAVGIIFVNLTPGYSSNLMSYLFGNILTVPNSEIIMMLILDAVILLLVVVFFKEFQAITFDEEYARTLGLPVDRLYLLLLVIIALTTVLLIKLVGIILVVALLSIPSAISIKFVKSIKQMMIMSVLLGLVFTISGLFLSYYLNLSSGAVIIMTASAGYLLSNFIHYIKKKFYIKGVNLRS
jgi:zinc transport system permease protein